MIRVPIDLDAPDAALAAAAFGPGALIRLERSATETGTFTEIATVAIVTATYHYDYWHATGLVTDFYRWRVSNAGNTQQSGYSDPYQAVDVASDTIVAARGLVPELLLRIDQDIDDTRLLNRFALALASAMDEVNEEIGYDFLRHPQSGTETRIFDGSGEVSLCLHGSGVAGVISLTLVEVRSSHSATWESLAAADWELQARNPAGGAPYDHLVLTGVGDYSLWPALVRTTGAYGWAKMPAVARTAYIARARQELAADVSLPGGIVGPEELGRTMGPNRMPDVTFRLIRREQQRDWCYV